MLVVQENRQVLNLGGRLKLCLKVGNLGLELRVHTHSGCRRDGDDQQACNGGGSPTIGMICRQGKRLGVVHGLAKVVLRFRLLQSS